MRRDACKSLLRRAVLLSLLLPVCARAGNVYRCGSAQAPVYSDRPCAAGAQPLQLAAPNGMAPPPQPPRADRDEAAAARRHRQTDEDWLKAYAARKQADETVRKGVVESRVVPGMTPDQVEHILNLPDARTATGSTERWTYKDGHNSRVVIFKDGRVVDEAPGHGRKKRN